AMEDDEAVRVNLQFSKRLPSAVIVSYMPGKAALEIEITREKQLLVRKPGWIGDKPVAISVDGETVSPRMHGSYYDFGKLPRGARVRINFPDELVRKREKIGEIEFTTLWRGNAVVRMEPVGDIYPLYQGRKRKDAVMPWEFVNAHPINPF